MIAVMRKTTMNVYREVISKRLERKKEQLQRLEKELEVQATGAEKRKYLKLEAKIEELETVLDIADSLSEMEDGNGKVLKESS